MIFFITYIPIYLYHHCIIPQDYEVIWLFKDLQKVCNVLALSVTLTLRGVLHTYCLAHVKETMQDTWVRSMGGLIEESKMSITWCP